MIAFLLKQTHIPVLVSLLLSLILALWQNPSFAQTVVSQQQASSVVAVDRVAVQDGTITGEIRNQSKNTVRDVQLFIRYTFLWKNEFRPGKESPSAVFYPTVSQEIPPGKSLPFKFTPSPPLPQRSDGTFAPPTVSVAGYTEIIQQMR